MSSRLVEIAFLSYCAELGSVLGCNRMHIGFSSCFGSIIVCFVPIDHIYYVIFLRFVLREMMCDTQNL